jgi:hypothetical protein
MIKKVCYFVLIPLAVITTIIQCTTPKNSNESFNFDWDMSVENHTGVSKDLYLVDGKHRGMSVFNWRKDNFESINQLIKNNIEWVAIVPFFYQETDTTKVMRTPDNVGTWSRRDSSFVKVIDKLHKRNLHVLLKPHLWMRQGWRSNIQFETEQDWDNWFESYRLNMIHYAQMAEELDVELLCIGAEFKTSILNQPHKWSGLIKEIKSIYHGKLTYAANWDSEYEAVQFWDQMDYIGIQAYFPLTASKNPSLKEIKKGWKKHIQMLEDLSTKYDKPILFSEVGYRSDETATIKPWEWDSSEEVKASKMSHATQHLAYEALFQQLWDQKWFAGMYFWQWHNTSSSSPRDSMDFTPRFKPAENTLAKWYGIGVN